MRNRKSSRDMNIQEKSQYYWNEGIKKFCEEKMVK